MTPRATALLIASLLVGCSHTRLSGADLDRVSHPAFVSRIEENAGPRAQVSGTDADRALAAKLAAGVSRFEVSERIPSIVYAALRDEKPWSHAIPPARVASVFERLLVEEVPPHSPDYGLLRPLGADSVVEFVVQDFGIRRHEGVVETSVAGYGRMFRLEGGEIWREPFSRTSTQAGLPPLDPAALADDARPFRDQLSLVLDAVGADMARALSPRDRRGGPALPPGSEELKTPRDAPTRIEGQAGRSDQGGRGTAPPDRTAPATLPEPDGASKKARGTPPPDTTAPTADPVSPKN